MGKEVYISYPCITRECGGYNMYPPLLLGRALTNTFTLTYTFIKTLNKKNQVISGGLTHSQAYLE